MPLCWVPSRSPGAAEFEVGFGYFEPIVGSHHDFQNAYGYPQPGLYPVTRMQ